MTYTIILRDKGVDRTYTARTHFDAIILFDALTKNHKCVELWHGFDRINHYNV